MIDKIDLERVRSEKTFPVQLKKLLGLEQFGTFRFACYISQYSLYQTVSEFITKATEDEWIEIERMYLDDWETRKYSKVWQMTIPSIENMEIKKENMKKLLRKDIEEFYEYYKIGI